MDFLNGASRVFASEDLLRPDASGARGLRDDLFVGLPDDPANVGVTVYSPTLREGSYLARKQDILRSCESLLSLRRGILSETNAETQPRTATEITAASVDYDLTIRSLQKAWEDCADDALFICSCLDRAYHKDHWWPTELRHRLGRRRAVRPKPRLGRAAADGGERPAAAGDRAGVVLRPARRDRG